MSYKVRGIVLEKDTGEKIIVEPTYGIDKLEPKVKELREFAASLIKQNLQDVKTLGIIEEGKITFGSVCVPKDWGSQS